MEDHFRYLLSSVIPKDGVSDSKAFETCITNFYKLKRVVHKEDLRNLDYVMFSTIDYFASSEGVLNKMLLYGFLSSTIDDFLRHKNVDVNVILGSGETTYNMDLEGSFELAKREVMGAIARYFDELTEIVTNPFEFNSRLKLYAQESFESLYMKILQNSAIIAKKGLDVWEEGKFRHLKGPEDSFDYFNRNVALAKSKYNLDQEEDFDTSGDVSQVERMEKTDEVMYDVISNTGLKPIDDALKDFRRTQLLGIESGSGVGKTRFARWIAYRALTVFKKNVFDITMEQEKTEIWAVYVSTHLYCKYNIYVPDSDIKRNLVPDHLKDIVKMAKYDLFTNKDYGRLRIKSETLFVEDMFELLTSIHKSEFKFDMLVLDYASLVEAKAQQKYGATMHEVVTKVYKGTKSRICRGLKVFAIVINQLTSKGVERLAKGEQTTTYDASNSGETYKSADANLVLSSNESLDRAGKICITSPKFRDAKKFYRVYASVKLGCSYFSYMEKEEMDEKEFEEAMEGSSYVA